MDGLVASVVDTSSFLPPTLFSIRYGDVYGCHAVIGQEGLGERPNAKTVLSDGDFPIQ